MVSRLGKQLLIGLLSLILATCGIPHAFATTANTIVNTTYVASTGESVMPSKDGNSVYATNLSTGGLIKFNTSGLTLLSNIPISCNDDYFSVADHNFNYIYFFCRGGTNVVQYNISANTSLSLNITYIPESGQLSPDDSTLYVVTTLGQVVTIPTAAFNSYTYHSISGPTSAGGSVISPDGSILYFCDDTNSKIYKISTSNYSVLGSASTSCKYLSISADGSTIVSGPYNYSASYAYVISTSNMLVTNTLLSGISYAGEGAFTGDGKYFYLLSSGNNNVIVYNTSNWSTLTTISLSGTAYALYAAMDQTTTYLYVVSNGGYYYQIYTGDPTILGTTVSLNISGTSYQFQHTGDLSISASLTGSDGYVTFYYNGKKIYHCVNLQSHSLTVSCNWKPSFHGGAVITASLSPSSNGYSGSTSNGTLLFISPRSVTFGS
jgi:DNA-binding beta-propeller fold protein YncE